MCSTVSSFERPYFSLIMWDPNAILAAFAGFPAIDPLNCSLYFLSIRSQGIIDAILHHRFSGSKSATIKFLGSSKIDVCPPLCLYMPFLPFSYLLSASFFNDFACFPCTYSITKWPQSQWFQRVSIVQQPLFNDVIFQCILEVSFLEK